jgi:hypothetical protein
MSFIRGQTQERALKFSDDRRRPLPENLRLNRNAPPLTLPLSGLKNSETLKQPEHLRRELKHAKNQEEQNGNV